MSKRRRKLIVLVGLNGAGKTVAILEMMKSFQHGKILIYDRQLEPEYSRFAEISLDLVKHMQKGTYRVTGTDWQEIITRLNEIPFDEGLLILEDSQSYLTSQEYKPLSDILVSRRHRGTDITLCFHSLNRVPPYVLEAMDTLVLFKTNDNPEAHIKQSIPRPELILRFYNQVERHQWDHYHAVINVRDLKPVTS